jgi:hypothetical protein
MNTRPLLTLCIAAGLLLAGARAAATPSTIIWIPAVDFQAFTSFHLNSDVYFRYRREPNGSMTSPLYLIGPTIGILPWEKLQAEVGFDLMFQGVPQRDYYPIYFHAKVGTPEDAMFKWAPAVVAGVYNLGIKSGVTTQDIVYGLVGRTLPYVGRLSLGYFWSQLDNGPAGTLALVDENGKASNHGFLASWDRTMKEISPKLWLAIDYQGSMSWMGAVSFGVAWSFTDMISMIAAYDLYINRKVNTASDGSQSIVAGRDTITVQLDINFERIRKPKSAPAATK